MESVGMRLGFVGGLFSVLSPCVLAWVPIVLGAAVAEHKLGPVALAVGLALSFTAIGMFIATVGYTIGLDGDVFRSVAAVLLVLVGGVLVVPQWQSHFAFAAGPVSNWTEQRFGGVRSHGLWGRFGVGGVLGAIWRPCVGPTLGSATDLASQGKKLGQ